MQPGLLFPIFRYRVVIAVLLILTQLSTPLAALASPQAEAGGLALANVDAVQAKILRRMAEEAVYLRALDQEQLKTAIRDGLATALIPVQEAFMRASRLVAKKIGAFDSEATVRAHIEQALTQVDVEASLSDLEARIAALVSDRAWHSYTAYRARMDSILYEEIEASGLLKPLTAELVDELKLHIATLGPAIQGESLHGAPLDLPQSFPVYTAVSAAVLVVVKTLLYDKLAAALGITLPLFWPLALGIMAVAILKDVDAARTQKIHAAQEAIQQAYVTLAESVREEDVTTKLMAAAAASIQQRLRADLDQGSAALHQFFDGILAQAQSPGYAAFIKDYAPEEGVKIVKRISATFGRRLIAEVPFGLKYQLASSVDAARATAMIERHGVGFVELFTRQSRPVVQIMDHPRYQLLLDAVLQSGQPDAELLFYKFSFDRFGALDTAQTDALMLARRLHPLRRVEDLDKSALTVLGQTADRLALLERHNPDVAATVVDWTLRRQMDAQLLQRLARRADMELLFTLLSELRPEPFAKALTAVGEDTLIRFVDDVALSRAQLDKALILLRDDAPGYLHAYAHPEAGGARAVRVRQALVREHEHRPLNARQEHTLLWLLARTGFDERHLRRATLDDLHAAGIPGFWPGFIALPLAKTIVHVGLTLPFFAMLVTLALALLLLWRRGMRFRLPHRRLARVGVSVLETPGRWLKPVGKDR